MLHSKSIRLVTILALLSLVAFAQSGDDKKSNDPFKGMTWRSVGPNRGGRVLAVSGVVGDPNTYYFGAVAGGVWKTTDGGLNWRPVSDTDFKTVSGVGALAVAESDPNVIYVGTGEACIRGNIVGGEGVYKSIDSGKTWKFMGLKDTHAIGRVIIHPKNPDIAFVAAFGHPFGPNPDRGLYRTTDGGKNWEKVLYKDDKSGAIDVAFDPNNPNIMFAALWQAVRKPWTMESGGPGSGLYKSTDGGSTWKKIEGNGFPTGTIGRIGVTVSGGNGNRVWALIENEKGGLFRSDDGGDNWQLLNDDRNYRQRAFYYTHVFADPKSADTVYILNTGTYRSVDGGKTFTGIRSPHGDNHGLWIDPQNPKRMINGNDGGATVSVNGGETWSTIENQPTAQFYHVSTDNRFPYYIYGAQQDNSTVAIASASDRGNIDRSDWYDVGGGESGYVVADPRDPMIVYAGSYGGNITRYDHRTAQSQDITAWPFNPIGWAGADLKHRFQWTEPIAFSPHDPHVLYHAAEVLFKTTDEGHSWTIISPDLTRNDKATQAASGGPITKDNTGVEIYNTIFSVVESSKQKDLIWVGTDDGLVQITQDAGAHWSNVTPKDLPEWATVDMIEASPFDADTAYVAADRHRLDDFSPYIYKTSDFGKSWTKLVNGIPADYYVHAVREDPAHKGLLFAATEKGMYVSFNDGKQWQSLQTNLPVVPVNDIVIHNGDLIAATHGRSFWVLDNITALEQWNESTANEDAHLFTPRAASHTIFGPTFFSTLNAATLGRAGANPPGGVVLYYWLKNELKKEDPKKDDAKPADGKPSDTKSADANPQEKKPTPPPDSAPLIKLEILDASGKVIRVYPKPGDAASAPGAPNTGLPTAAGMNRFIWNELYEDASSIPGSPLWGGSTSGPQAVPGKYTARLSVKGSVVATTPIEIQPDPRIKTTQAELQEQLDLLLKIRARVTEVHDTVKQIRNIRKQIDDLNKRLAVGRKPGESADEHAKAIEDAGKDLDKKMTVVEEALIQTKAKSGQDVLNFPIRLNNHLVALGGVVSSADARPTKASWDLFDELSKQADEQMVKWKTIVSTDLPAYNAVVKQHDVNPVTLMPATELK